MDSVRGTAFLQYNELLAAHGASPRQFLSPHRVGMEVVGSYEKKISYKSLAQIFEGSAQGLHLPNFGMELAIRQGPFNLGPLHRLAQTAPTVEDGIVAILRYMRFYSPSFQFRLEHRSGRALIYFENNLPCQNDVPQIVEKSILQGCLLLGDMLGRQLKPRAILFRHSPQAVAETYRRYFNCTVLFNQDHNAISLEPGDLYRACSQQDAMLHDVLRFYLEAHCSSEMALRAEVELHIHALLPKQRCSLVQVSLRMGLHNRTLQRRLANESMEFEQMVDDLRRNRAEHLLRTSSLGVGQIARELGYRNSSSFCRAHKRWFDASPLEHRQQYTRE